MNCKWAEENLSAYLDDALDPPLSGEVGEHVAQCAHCWAILDDYQRFDLLLQNYPRVEPAPELKDRIFSSPEMVALLRQEADARGEPVEIPTPAGSETQAEPPHPAARPARRIVAASRVLLPVAAVLTLALGAALLFKQGLLPSAHTSTPTITTIGNPGSQAPLPAGTRLVYEREGELWSGRDDGQGVAQQLTPSGVQVAGWSISPVSGQAGASLVAYIDARTGAIHVIRGDRLNDTVIGHVAGSTLLDAAFWQTAAGQAAQAGLSWAPDGTRVAYLAVTSADSTMLHIVNVRGIGDTAVNTNISGLAADPLWSADSLYIAFTETHGSAQRVWAYSVAASQARELASQSGASARARAAHMSWVVGAETPTLTWAATDAGRLTGLYAAHARTAASATRLTPAGASYNAADFSTSRNGLWLVASGTKLTTVSATSGGMQQVATVAAAVTHISWSPTGDAAAVTGRNFVAIWSGNHGLTAVAQGNVHTDLIAWSPDGKSLAYVVGDTIKSTGATAALVQHVTDVAALRWSPDGQHLAIATPTAVLVVTRDGAARATMDTHAATDGSLLWTVVQ
ncbi:MAG TPA: zf-HC2 domain-containing protein [Ktedonobacterales bacterium]|jgi:WD40 repeat protein|nr:zf-HC2 domain-containing protein [Ktedonobacterales bacterium]